MKILYHPQISMRSRATNRLITEHDAQWVKVKEVIRWLDNEGHEVHILLPTNADVPELVRERQERIAIHFIAGHGNVMRNRYHFGSRRIATVLGSFKPDVVWLEVPELVANYKSITDVPILATFEHFVEEYFWRQYEGFMEAEVRVIPTLELYEVFAEMALERLRTSELERFYAMPLAIWGNFVSEDDLLSVEDFVEAKVRPVPVSATTGLCVNILFPSRLTDYTRTKWAFSLNMIKRLLDKGYTVEICNPSEVEKPKIIRELETAKNGENLVFHTEKMSRREWLETIAYTDVAMMLYSFDRFYSVGAVEMLAAGVKLVTMKSDALSRIAGICRPPTPPPPTDEPGQLFFMDELNEETLVKTIERAVESEVTEYQMDIILARTSGTAWAPEIYKTLKEAAEMRPVDPVTVDMSEKA